MMATVTHVTSGSGLRKFQADGILLDRVYMYKRNFAKFGQWVQKLKSKAVKEGDGAGARCPQKPNDFLYKRKVH